MIYFLQACNNNIAWQRFLPNGVLALLPLSDQLSSIVWSTSTDNVKRLLALPETEFIDAVNECFVCYMINLNISLLITVYIIYFFFVNQWKQYDKSEIVSKVMGSIQSLFGDHSQSQRQLPPSIKSLYENSRAAFPLGFGHSSSYVSTGTALIGYVKLDIVYSCQSLVTFKILFYFIICPCPLLFFKIFFFTVMRRIEFTR